MFFATIFALRVQTGNFAAKLIERISATVCSNKTPVQNDMKKLVCHKIWPHLLRFFRGFGLALRWFPGMIRVFKQRYDMRVSAYCGEGRLPTGV